MEVAESWESVAVCAYMFLLLLKHPQRDLETEHWDRGTLALTHCDHSYWFMTRKTCGYEQQ